MADKNKVWDIVGWFVAPAAATIASGFIGWYTGSFGVVAEYANTHKPEVIIWSVTFLLAGILIGMFVRGKTAKKKHQPQLPELLKRRRRAKQALKKLFLQNNNTLATRTTRLQSGFTRFCQYHVSNKIATAYTANYFKRSMVLRSWAIVL